MEIFTNKAEICRCAKLCGIPTYTRKLCKKNHFYGYIYGCSDYSNFMHFCPNSFLLNNNQICTLAKSPNLTLGISPDHAHPMWHFPTCMSCTESTVVYTLWSFGLSKPVFKHLESLASFTFFCSKGSFISHVVYFFGYF